MSVERTPLLITRRTWDSVPANKRRVWKDGTKAILMRTPGGGSLWQVVYWNS